MPKKIGEAGFFHLYTVPYSPQLNAIESLFAQVKSHALHEFACAPERRKDIESVIGEAFRKGEKGHVEATADTGSATPQAVWPGPLVSDGVVLDSRDGGRARGGERERPGRRNPLQSIERYNRLKRK